MIGLQTADRGLHESVGPKVFLAGIINSRMYGSIVQNPDKSVNPDNGF